MPIAIAALVWGGATLLGGGGLYLTGKAVDETSNAALKLTIAAAVSGGAFLYLKKRGVI